jgi:ankyrin repeat protein
LINAHPPSIKALTNNKNTPLHYAAIQGNESIMELLIKKYPKAVAQRNADGEWPIDLAIKHGVDPNVLEVFELSTSVPKKCKKGKASNDVSSEVS